VFFITIDPERQKVVLAALRNSAGPIRGLLGKAMSLRVVPELVFKLDTSEEKAREMDRLLDSIRIKEDVSPEKDIDADGDNG
jgi:ribosome-binding factor A